MGKLFLANLKIFIRDKDLLFWSMMFPLMFTFIFGFFFGKGSTSTGTIVLIEKSNSQLSQDFSKALDESKLFKIEKDQDVEAAKDKLKRGNVGAIVVVPEGFGQMQSGVPTTIKVIYDPANTQINSVILSFTNSFLTKANYAVKNFQPVFAVEEEKTSTRQLNYFDFVLIGLIGMALMNSSIQGVAIGMSKYREDRILKRIVTTPLAAWRFIVSYILARLVINFAQVSLILLVGVFVFDAHIYGSLVLLYLFGLIGAILFQLIGFTIAGLVKTTNAAEGMATAISIPMMFLTGVFFPIDQLPKWLYNIVQYLPLAPLLRMIRQIGLEAVSPLTNPMNIAIVLFWIVVTLIISIWKFRLADE
ncbi:MAG: ABC transporter permease [Patescibacteria group bacterium]|nr:ABC transporter permease [Patescibacteria group bacterium]